MNVEITATGSELQGVGRLADGRAVFVPGALPGELVAIEPVKEKDRYVEGRLLQILRPSVQRVAPACPAYGQCGGCQAQHMTYACALALKRQKVVDALTRLGGQTEVCVADTLPSPQVMEYRNKAEFAVRRGRIGTLRAQSNTLVEIDACPLQAPESNQILCALRERITESDGLYAVVTRVNAKGEAMVTLATEARARRRLQPLAEALRRELPFLVGVHQCELRPRPAHALDGTIRPLWGAMTLTDELQGLRFALAPQAFFQVNRPQANALYEVAMRMAALNGSETVLDAYCGAGTISLTAARHAARVVGVEIVPEAVQNARDNARMNGLAATFEHMDAAEALSGRLKIPTPDVLIVDPPRHGVDSRLIQATLHAQPQRIVYVSCHAATLARDIRLWTESGRYHLEAVQPVDMFPQTAHIETVVLLSKGEISSKNVRVEFSLEEMDMS